MTLSPKRRLRPAVMPLLVLIAICCTISGTRAHETSWARPARGQVLSIDRIADTIVFLPDEGRKDPWLMDLESSTRYYENGKSVSAFALKRHARVEVFYRTPIFGNRFISKVVWNRDDTARGITSGERQQTNTVSGLWAAIHRQFEALGNSIDARQLTEVPAAAARIRDLTTALTHFRPEPPDCEVKLSNQIALVGHWTRRMESAVVKADQAAVEHSYKKLKKTLRAVASLYPPEMLKLSIAPDGKSQTETQQQCAP